MPPMFATRQMELRLATGQSIELSLAVASPEPTQDDFECECRLVDGSGQTRAWKGYGVDGIQAMLHALMIASAELDLIARQSGGTVFWLEGNGHGLPPPGAFPTAPGVPASVPTT